jgi:cyclic 2,3-diphosphoglycerate synthetase
VCRFFTTEHGSPHSLGWIAVLLDLPLWFPCLEVPNPSSRRLPIRYVAIVDGEHYPPVVASALASLVSEGHEVLAAVLVGGREKLPLGGVTSFGSVPVVTAADGRDALLRAINDYRPGGVIDLSDEPVLDYRRRFALASVALWAGLPYVGADFELRPPRRDEVATKPAVGVIGTGKRTGKTAIGGFFARTLTSAGHKPVLVAMGRGGPEEPEVLDGDSVSLEPHDLLRLAEAGKHAASDYVEDALLGRVATVGCRRCGGGLAGGVEISNVAEGVRIANGLPGDCLVLEGSGSAIPPVAAHSYALIVPASIDHEYLAGYLGGFRLLLADCVIVTMAEEPFGSPSKISSLTSLIHSAWRPSRASGSADRTAGKEAIQVVRTVFRPTPTKPVEGSRVFVATTAPESVAAVTKSHLESVHGCEVVGITHALSDRGRLTEELKAMEGRADVLLCEIKAAAIDVATRRALDIGMQVVYMDNVPQGIEGDDLQGAVLRAKDLAFERASGR